MRYGVKIQWSDEDQAFVAWVPDLPGCMAHGDTYQAALESILSAMEAQLEVCQELGRDVPEPSGKLEMNWSESPAKKVSPSVLLEMRQVPKVKVLRKAATADKKPKAEKRTTVKA